MERPGESPSPSAADMKAAIHETRSRLAVRLAETANHVHLLYAAPFAIETEPPASGALGRAIKTIAAAGRARRAWTEARRTGLLRRAVLGAVTMAVAAALATRRQRR
jgi:hypothetical protein